MSKWEIDINFVEQGDIYFFYKPKKGVSITRSIDDVSRFFFVLQPEGDKPPRYIVMGDKKLPELTDSGSTAWGFVQMVGGRGFKTTAEQTAPRKGTSRPVGEGIYAIVSHREHIHLFYTIELPQKLGEVQKAFNIQKEANYILLERPVEKAPHNADAPFSNFSPATVHNLDKRGTEVLLIGVGTDIGRLGIKAIKDAETINSADIFSKLHVNKERHPTGSLITGVWE